jgi:hypothetical protein
MTIAKVTFELDGIGGFYHSYGYSANYGIEKVEGATHHRSMGYSSVDYGEALDEALEMLGVDGLDDAFDNEVKEQFAAFMERDSHPDGTEELAEAEYLRVADGGSEHDHDIDRLAILITVWISDK